MLGQQDKVQVGLPTSPISVSRGVNSVLEGGYIQGAVLQKLGHPFPGRWSGPPKRQVRIAIHLRSGVPRHVQGKKENRKLCFLECSAFFLSFRPLAVSYTRVIQVRNKIAVSKFRSIVLFPNWRSPAAFYLFLPLGSYRHLLGSTRSQPRG